MLQICYTKPDGDAAEVFRVVYRNKIFKKKRSVSRPGTLC